MPPTDLPPTPPPEALEEVAAASERARELFAAGFSLELGPGRWSSRVRGELRRPGGGVACLLTAGEVLALACGDARRVSYGVASGQHPRMSDEPSMGPTSPEGGAREAQEGPGRGGTEEAQAAKAGTPRRSPEGEAGSERSVASEAAAQSGDELAEGARGDTDRG